MAKNNKKPYSNSTTSRTINNTNKKKNTSTNRNTNNRNKNNNRSINKTTNENKKVKVEENKKINIEEEKKVNLNEEVVSSKPKQKTNLENTTRIRIDMNRINDSESLDTSFLEGRMEHKADDKKTKEKILAEKREFVNLKIIKNIFFFLAIACIVFIGILVLMNHDFSKEKNVKTPVVENNKTKVETIVDRNYLFVGDFYTEDFSFEDATYDYHYVKESKSDYTTLSVLNEIDKTIYQYNPSVVFLQLGIMDLDNDSSVEDIISNLKKIINGIQRNRPYAEIYLESLYPLNKDVDDYDESIIKSTIENSDIIDINKKIKSLAKTEKIHYIDMFNELLEDGNLKENYTDNGVTLNEDGYKRVVKIINNVLDDER